MEAALGVEFLETKFVGMKYVIVTLWLLRFLMVCPVCNCDRIVSEWAIKGSCLDNA